MSTPQDWLSAPYRWRRSVTYSVQKLEALQAAVERLEGGKTFDPKVEASDEVSGFFQVPADSASPTEKIPSTKTAEVTDRRALGKMVPVRAFAKRVDPAIFGDCRLIPR